MWRLFRLLALILLSLNTVSAGQSLLTELSPKETSVQGGATQATGGQPNQRQDLPSFDALTVPSYPDSPAGLEKLMKDMLDLAKRGEKAALTPYFQSLVLPNAASWFPSKFGNESCEAKQMAANDCLGSRLALTYESTARTLPAAAAMTMRDLPGEGLINFEAVNYTAPCPNPQRIIPARKLVGELTTTPILSPVLSGLVRNHQPVYVLWAYSESKETMLAFFVYSEGAFRYIGMPHPASLEDFARRNAAAQGGTEPSQPVSSAAASDDLTDEVLDVKPVLADQNLVQRTVVLYVIIGTDGKVREASYVRGPEEFKDAAIQSVKRRKFSPQVFGGQPVQVATCISVDSHR